MARPWYEDPANLAALWRWLDERCEAPAVDDVPRFLDEPWHWEHDWNQMQSEVAHAA